MEPTSTRIPPDPDFDRLCALLKGIELPRRAGQRPGVVVFESKPRRIDQVNVVKLRAVRRLPAVPDLRRLELVVSDLRLAEGRDEVYVASITRLANQPGVWRHRVEVPGNEHYDGPWLEGDTRFNDSELPGYIGVLKHFYQDPESVSPKMRFLSGVLVRGLVPVEKKELGNEPCVFISLRSQAPGVYVIEARRVIGRTHVTVFATRVLRTQMHQLEADALAAFRSDLRELLRDTDIWSDRLDTETDQAPHIQRAWQRYGRDAVQLFGEAPSRLDLFGRSRALVEKSIAGFLSEYSLKDLGAI